MVRVDRSDGPSLTDLGVDEAWPLLGLACCCCGEPHVDSRAARIADLRRKYLQYAARMDETEIKIDHIVRRLNQARAGRRLHAAAQPPPMPAACMLREFPDPRDESDEPSVDEPSADEEQAPHTSAQAYAHAVSCGVQCVGAEAAAVKWSSLRAGARHGGRSSRQRVREGAAAEGRAKCYSCRVGNTLCALLLLFAAWEFYHCLFNT